ncbi:MAG: methylamine utilization protein MauJ [Acidiphilium sp.]
MSKTGRLIGNSAKNSMQVPLEQLGAPGTRGLLTIVPVLRGEEAADERRTTDTEEREFICTIQLIRETSSTPEINGAFTANDGGSFLSPPTGSSILGVNTSYGNFTIESNATGELSIVTIRVRKTSLAEAASSFNATVTPLLDRLSFVANVPVRTGTLKIYDKRNEVQQITFVSPFRQAVVNNHFGEVHSELEPVYALYREARNSESPYYQLLCFYKIIDGLSKLKGRTIRQARSRGIQLPAPNDIVPDHPDLAVDLRQHIGKSIKQFQDAVLTRRYRDAIAHFQLSDASVLQVSSPAELARFCDAAFAAELCVRVSVGNCEDLVRKAKAAHQSIVR